MLSSGSSSCMTPWMVTVLLVAESVVFTSIAEFAPESHTAFVGTGPCPDAATGADPQIPKNEQLADHGRATFSAQGNGSGDEKEPTPALQDPRQRTLRVVAATYEAFDYRSRKLIEDLSHRRHETHDVDRQADRATDVQVPRGDVD